MEVVMRRFLFLLATLACFMRPDPVPADEGMWLFNNPPKDLLRKKYGFEPTKEWLDHVQKSSVRFNTGGSGSFVSADGLVMTNHHVGLQALEKLSNQNKKDYVKNGFYAKTYAEEFKSVDEELNVLMEIVDVTKEVKGAVDPKMSDEQAFAARRKVIANIETESKKATGLRSNVVPLYQGNQYHLYRFKQYKDVRLVFAPEQDIAFYGGDPDNFAFPRYDLDVCFFRVYEDGKPAKIDHYFTWSKGGAKENELVFVSGHPGHTDRLNTVAELEYLRDIGFPFILQRLNRLEVMLSTYSQLGEEEARRAKDSLFGVANSRKARIGGLQGLQDPAIMAQKRADEKKMREAVAKDPALKDVVDAWNTVADVQKVRAENIKKYTILEGGAGFYSPLFGYARSLVRAAEERAKPNEERLPEFQKAGEDSLLQKLLADATHYPDYELYKLTDSLGWMCEILGAESPAVKVALAGKSPPDRALELVTGTKLWEVAERKRLYEGGKAAIDASTDPMILLARAIDAPSRAVRKIMENQVEEPKSQAYDKIARAKFAIEGTNTYPDATFTLRLAFGTCIGYTEAGKKIPFETTFAGLYEKCKDKNDVDPFKLPQRWFDRKSKLNLNTPFNFVCTADIIGGNSGSPVVNKNAEIVGLIFDGNIQSLVLDFLYTEDVARAVSVSSPAIPEALRAIYEANDLADEIVHGKR
jgi:Peptidase S46